MVTQRSRTGCLTCRKRKLKCDEQKPVCSQCIKASRECEPADGMVWRNQQNASMNGAGGRNGLSAFYRYRQTFDSDQTWVTIPSTLIFHNCTNPFVEELDPALTTQPQPLSDNQRAEWGGDTSYQTSAREAATHGLEALSEVAAQDQYPYMQPTPTNDQGMMSAPSHYHAYSPHDMLQSPTSERRARQARQAMPPPPSPSASYNLSSASNNIDFLLNHANHLSPVIDPSLESSMEHQLPVLTSPAIKKRSKHDRTPSQQEETDQEMAASLLRGIADDHSSKEQEDGPRDQNG